LGMAISSGEEIPFFESAFRLSCGRYSPLASALDPKPRNFVTSDRDEAFF